MRVRFGLAGALVAASLWACGGSSGSGDVGVVSDAGQQSDAGHDAGCTGASCQPDAGSDAGTDAGTDGGTDGGSVLDVPNSAGWIFYHSPQGLIAPAANGASVDEGGNLWVAGGTGGLFLLRKGGTQFEQFGLAQGLHPYGYMPDGSPSDHNPYLETLSVSGGVGGQVFVGYNGKTVSGETTCEDNWDVNPPEVPDPAVYKSGDADKVTLTASGISVVHYDIFSGPNVVHDEPRGREKLCNILKVVYQHGTNNVWFGGNHGFAWGHADFQGNPTCDGEYPGDPTAPPHANCAGVWEHVHPAIDGPGGSILTGDYRGVAVDPQAPHDIWFGGINRSTLFKFGSLGDFYSAMDATQNDASNILDVWPDTIPNTQVRQQPMDDNVSGMAAKADGTVYVASFAHGVRHLAHNGSLIGDVTGFDPHVTAIALDPDDGSLWIGHTGFGLGVTQILGNGSIKQYGAAALGDLASLQVTDIQIDTFTKVVDPSHQSRNRVIISFGPGFDPASAGKGGAVAVFTNQ
jgi:hypothetical protein